MTSFAGRWFALCRRNACSETANTDESERFDESPTRARSMASRSECSHTLHLRGTVPLPPLTRHPRRRHELVFGGLRDNPLGALNLRRQRLLVWECPPLLV